MNNILSAINIGPAAALLTAVCWTICALCFEYSSKKVGSMSVNLLRLYGAFILFAVFSLIFRGRPLPTDASGQAWFWLSLSGIVGFVAGDYFLFKSFVIIGSRTSMLVMSLSPPVTVLTGFLILGETMTAYQAVGMAMTTTGVAAVVLTRKDGTGELKHPLKGIVFAALGMLGQSVGLVLGKFGMGDYNAFAATHIRIIAGVIGFTVLFFHFRAWNQFADAFKNPKAMGWIAAGTLFGPFLGVYLALFAVQHTTTGVVSTIISIVPVLLIPFAMTLFKEKINLKEIIAAVIAVIGTAIMFA